jgi:mannitol/fructose-specific phosphotransferase system IIA component (Ntr-type)
LNKEQRLLALIGDLSETHQRTMTAVFDKLNEDNQRNFLAVCDTPEGIEKMLDFSIQNRGA